jgi:hypothetical protein
MALLVTQQVALPSLLEAPVAAAGGGDTVTPGNFTWLEVTNGGGAPINVTVVVPGNDEYGTAKPDLVVAVANATTRKIPMRSYGFIDPSTNLINITYSAVTSVTVGAYSL